MSTTVLRLGGTDRDKHSRAKSSFRHLARIRAPARCLVASSHSRYRGEAANQAMASLTALLFSVEISLAFQSGRKTG
jgi:hypothetical protein